MKKYYEYDVGFEQDIWSYRPGEESHRIKVYACCYTHALDRFLKLYKAWKGEDFKCPELKINRIKEVAGCPPSLKCMIRRAQSWKK